MRQSKSEAEERSVSLINAILDRDIPDDLRERLLEWFESDVNEKEKFAALEKVIFEVLAPQLIPSPFVYKKLEELKERLQAESARKSVFKRSPKRIMLRIAAVLVPAALVVGGYLWYDGVRSAGDVFPTEYIVSVPADGQKHIVLEDGTEVTLNRNSEFHGKGREYFLSGEGYFRVTKSKTPFVVHSGNLEVTVLGTEFNLSDYPGSVLSVVRLFTGAVSVDNGSGDPEELQPGSEYIYNRVTHETNVTAFDPDDNHGKPSWINNGGSFVGYSLIEIFRQIETGYGVTILNKEILDTTQRYTFKLDGDSLATIMESLRAAGGNFDYKIEGNTIILGPIKK